jgi:hypothetical protein
MADEKSLPPSPHCICGDHKALSCSGHDARRPFCRFSKLRAVFERRGMKLALECERNRVKTRPGQMGSISGGL